MVLRLVIVALVFCVGSSVGFTSPLMDYSQGKGSIDLTVRDTTNGLYVGGESVELSKKYNFDGALTLGLGKKLAFQYRHFSPKSADTTFVDADGDASIGTLHMHTNEFSLLHKLDKSVALMAGLITTNGVATDRETGSYETSNVHAKTFWHIGVVASTAIAKNTTLWASASAGANLISYEVGIGYAFTPNWEVNVNYRGMDLKNLNSDNSNKNGNVTLKGLGVGVSYKF